MMNQKIILPLVLALSGASAAWAQVPYDPPTAQRAAPNVLLLLDASRTTMINGSGCRGRCHGEIGANSEYDTSLYIHGQTRLQLARRVLTGGWGYETSFVSDFNGNGVVDDGRNTLGTRTCSCPFGLPECATAFCNSGRCIDHDLEGSTSRICDADSGPADGLVRRDGVMDQYRVRWSVVQYDGLGPRLVQPPTIDSDLAQRRVIDFGNPNFGENLGGGWRVSVSPDWGGTPFADRHFNSYLPFYRTGAGCCAGPGDENSHTDGNVASVPYYDDLMDETHGSAVPAASGRMTRSLQFVRDYLASNAATFPQWNGSDRARIVFGAPPWESAPGVSTIPGNVFRGDIANVLNQQPPNGCRRNFVIQMTDGHGAGNYGGQSRGAVAAQIHNMLRNDGTQPTANYANQVFSLHFGVQDKPNADTVANCGFDGNCANGIPLAFEGAPGGVIEDLTPMYAAFTAIFQLVLSGTYLGAPPTITNSGDRVVTSTFQIQDCSGALPNQCNIGRIGNLTMDEIEYDPATPTVAEYGDQVRFGDVLRATAYDRRNVLTSVDATASNCGAQATCPSQTATMEMVLSGAGPGSITPQSPATALTHSDFLRGNPSARFANGVQRSNVSNGNAFSASYVNPYKLMDIANSRPVVVGAPAGIGEDIERWEAFLNSNISRSMAAGWNQKGTGFGAATTVSRRDQVVYIGGNDGLIHAFLAGVASGPADTGRTVSYPITPGQICAQPTGANPTQQNIANCIGTELWAYSPRLVQPFWNDIRSGHYFMVDGTPTVSDVLFTKSSNTPGTRCTSLFATCGWEYRTVLLQCLGGGGPGCFALDVSNPYSPRVLWERDLTVPLATTGGSIRDASTSRPQIVRVRKNIGGRIVPYYVGIMGGGIGETDGSDRQGSIIAMGLEDGDWYFSQQKAVGGDFAGAPTCLDTDGDSFVETCYIATTNARLYKVRIGILNDGNLGSSAAITLERFFDGREYLQTPAGGSVSSAVADATRTYGRVVATFDRARDLRLFFGTGNFEDVQNASEQNYMFAVTDRTPEAAPTWSTAENSARALTSCSGNGVIPLPMGEKILFDPVISNGVAVFTSYAPNVNPCIAGRSFLNGVTVDDCSAGIDSDEDGTADTGLPPGGLRGAGEGFEGLAVAPVINEHTGGITVATNTQSAGAQIHHEQGYTRRLPAPPVSKLWWRLVR